MSIDAPRTGKVFVFGSANRDHVLTVSEFPDAGQTVMARSYSLGLGGKGANQAVAAARAGGEVGFIGAVGTDEPGDDVLANLAAHGIDTRSIARSGTSATGVAIVLVDDRGSNEIIVAPGANADIAPAAIDAALGAVAPEDVVVVQCEISIARVEQIIRGGARTGATVLVNLAPYTVIGSEHFREVSLLIVNESEARAFVGDREADEGLTAERLASAVAATASCACIVTMGAEGSVHASLEGEITSVRAAPVEDVVDTTGAGDVYVGTLAASLARRDEIADAMALASEAAARSVSSRGAQAQHTGHGP